MNFYCLVEGRVTEKAVYSAWIPLINPSIRIVDFLSQVSDNHAIVISGEGYPNILGIIKAAALDIAQHGGFDRFVLGVDSEEMDVEAKYHEMKAHVDAASFTVPTHIIIQHYCFETWALGNRRVGSKRPVNPDLASWKRRYDVAKLDPSLMESLSPNLNRAQFSETYLRKLLNDQHKSVTYSKSDPSVICHHKYFEQVKMRLDDTGHIDSFREMIRAFS